MLINNIVTVIASVFVGYYKAIELLTDWKKKRDQKYIIYDNEENETVRITTFED
jgi:hypothetical protein